MINVKKTKRADERKATLAAMQALAAAEVMRQPAYRGPRASWLRTLLVPIAKDRAGLMDAPLDLPLTAEELAMFADLVELVDEAAAGREAEVAAALTP